MMPEKSMLRLDIFPGHEPPELTQEDLRVVEMILDEVPQRCSGGLFYMRKIQHA
jgi:hypothetical protein